MVRGPEIWFFEPKLWFFEPKYGSLNQKYGSWDRSLEAREPPRVIVFAVVVVVVVTVSYLVLWKALTARKSHHHLKKGCSRP